MLVITLALVAHWIADFILQPRWMAKEKSTSNLALAQHCIIYTSVMSLVGIAIMISSYKDASTSTLIILSVAFGVFQGIMHYIVDYFTSRLAKYCYVKSTIEASVRDREQWESKFWVVIGFDQMIHMIILLGSIIILR